VDAARCEMTTPRVQGPLTAETAERAWFDKLTLSAHPEPVEGCDLPGKTSSRQRTHSSSWRWPAIGTAVAVALGVVGLAAQDGQWPMYSGSYASHRFSPLRQIAADNVARLRPVWVYQPPGAGSVECTPIVAGGVMYVTSGPTSVVALDLRSGKSIWEWTRPIAASVLNLGFPRVNRGVAILDNTVYVGTLDGYLVALDAKAGIQRWAVHVGENPTGHSITAAPLIVGDKVIVGISGGEAGIRGFLDAYDAKTGAQVWRFWTVPSPGEPGSDSWPGDSWVHGGGA